MQIYLAAYSYCWLQIAHKQAELFFAFGFASTVLQATDMSILSISVYNVRRKMLFYKFDGLPAARRGKYTKISLKCQALSAMLEILQLVAPPNQWYLSPRTRQITFPQRHALSNQHTIPAQLESP